MKMKKGRNHNQKISIPQNEFQLKVFNILKQVEHRMITPKKALARILKIV